MKQYTFNKTDSGIIGKAFEKAIKDVLRCKYPDRVSPQGETDFRYMRKCYDVKQNGTCLQYSGYNTMIKGSSRVIYATHVAYAVTAETDTTITIVVDLASTEMFCVDRDDFVRFLLDAGLVKYNESRGTVNIQTCYNYTKNAYHGRTGKKIEEWCYENENDEDDIIGAILGRL